MKPISAPDASVLALIAENSGISETDLNRLMEHLSAEEARQIARAIVDLRSNPPAEINDEFLETAKAILDWVKGNTRPPRVARRAVPV